MGTLSRASCARPFGLARLSAIPGSEFLRGGGFCPHRVPFCRELC